MSFSGEGFLDDSEIDFRKFANKTIRDTLTSLRKLEKLDSPLAAINKWKLEEKKMFLKCMGINTTNIGDGFLDQITPELFRGKPTPNFVNPLLCKALKVKSGKNRLNVIGNGLARLRFVLLLFHFHYRKHEEQTSNDIPSFGDMASNLGISGGGSIGGKKKKRVSEPTLHDGDVPFAPSPHIDEDSHGSMISFSGASKDLTMVDSPLSKEDPEVIIRTDVQNGEKTVKITDKEKDEDEEEEEDEEEIERSQEEEGTGEGGKDVDPDAVFLDYALVMINIKLHEMYNLNEIPYIRDETGQKFQKYQYMTEVYSYEGIKLRLRLPLKITPDMICKKRRKDGKYRVTFSVVITDTGRRTWDKKFSIYLFNFFQSETLISVARILSKIPIIGPKLLQPLLDMNDSLDFGVFHMGICIGMLFLDMTDLSLVWPQHFYESNFAQYSKAVYKRLEVFLTYDELLRLSEKLEEICIEWDQKIYSRINKENQGSCHLFFKEVKRKLDHFFFTELKIEETEEMKELKGFVDHLIKELKTLPDLTTTTIRFSDDFEKILKDKTHEKHRYAKGVITATCHDQFDKSFSEIKNLVSGKDYLLLKGFDRSMWMKEIRMKEKFLKKIRQAKKKLRKEHQKGGKRMMAIEEVRKILKKKAEELRKKYLDTLNIDVTYDPIAEKCPFGCPLDEISSSTLPCPSELQKRNAEIKFVLENGVIHLK